MQLTEFLKTILAITGKTYKLMNRDLEIYVCMIAISHFTAYINLRFNNHSYNIFYLSLGTCCADKQTHKCMPVI